MIYVCLVNSLIKSTKIDVMPIVSTVIGSNFWKHIVINILIPQEVYFKTTFPLFWNLNFKIDSLNKLNKKIQDN